MDCDLVIKLFRVRIITRIDEKELVVYQEKRKFVRIKSCCTVKVLRCLGQFDESLTQSKNLSQGGLLFTYEGALGLNEVIFLEVRLPEIGKVVKTYARVVRENRIGEGYFYDVGVQFIQFEKEGKKELEDYINLFSHRVAENCSD